MMEVFFECENLWDWYIFFFRVCLIFRSDISCKRLFYRFSCVELNSWFEENFINLVFFVGDSCELRLFWNNEVFKMYGF